jgi:isoquinoline 1-oxidoreductase alpha subunit
MSVQFKVNGKSAKSDAPPATPLLWVIREELKLTGTKFGCGTGLCGACMVHIDGKRAFSCPTPAIRYRRRGSPSACRSVATASPARS